jgi:RNA polymerase sigma-70 factor (ECF subfamily)
VSLADRREGHAEGAELIRRISVNADREAFSALFQLFGPRVKGYLIRHGASPAQAEDLTQETLITVWRKASYFDPSRASPAAWIYTIARNLRIDALRHERAALVYDDRSDERPDDAPPADEDMVTAERDQQIRKAMHILPQEQVEVLRMSFFQDKPHSEIARELHLPLGTVKSRVRLALARLRSALGDGS